MKNPPVVLPKVIQQMKQMRDEVARQQYVYAIQTVAEEIWQESNHVSSAGAERLSLDQAHHSSATPVLASQ